MWRGEAERGEVKGEERRGLFACFECLDFASDESCYLMGLH